MIATDRPASERSETPACVLLNLYATFTPGFDKDTP